MNEQINTNETGHPDITNAEYLAQCEALGRPLEKLIRDVRASGMNQHAISTTLLTHVWNDLVRVHGAEFTAMWLRNTASVIEKGSDIFSPININH